MNLRSRIIAQVEQAASTEVAKKTDHQKNVKKLTNVVKSLGIEAGDWKTLSDAVFHSAFNKKKSASSSTSD